MSRYLSRFSVPTLLTPQRRTRSIQDAAPGEIAAHHRTSGKWAGPSQDAGRRVATPFVTRDAGKEAISWSTGCQQVLYSTGDNRRFGYSRSYFTRSNYFGIAGSGSIGSQGKLAARSNRPAMLACHWESIDSPAFCCFETRGSRRASW
jgi:hypothetical protein